MNDIDLIVGDLYNIATDKIELFDLEYLGNEGERAVFEDEEGRVYYIIDIEVEDIEGCGCRRECLISDD